MKRYISYLKYIIKHKYYVFLACIKLKVPIRLALLHDLSKFAPNEFIPISRTTFDKKGKMNLIRDKSGTYDPGKQPQEFQESWLNHQKKNKHHWQSWILIGEGGKLNPVPIPEAYIKEMLADWIGAGKALKNKITPKEYYYNNKNKIILHPESRIKLEELLNTY